MRVWCAISLLMAGCHIVSGLGDLEEGSPAAGGAGGTGSGGDVGGGGAAVAGSGGDGAGSGGGGGAPVLDDTNLVARYFIDEASVGTGPSMVLDAASMPAALPIVYADNIDYVEQAGNRGLQWAGGVEGVVGDTVSAKLVNALSGSTMVTIEMVVQQKVERPYCTRVFHIGRGASAFGQLVACFANGDLRLRFNGNTRFQRDLAVVDTGRRVMHVVIDTTESEQADRIRVFVDGMNMANTTSAMSQGEALDVQSGDYVSIGNRAEGDRAFGGLIFYVAIYDVAFEDERVAGHNARLQMGDDTSF